MIISNDANSTMREKRSEEETKRKEVRMRDRQRDIKKISDRLPCD